MHAGRTHRAAIAVAADSGTSSVSSQFAQGLEVAEGFYNIQLMLGRVTHSHGQVGVCGTCMDARGIQASELSTGAERSSMDQLAQWTEWADKVLVF